MRKAILDLNKWSAEDINNLPDMQVDGRVWLPDLKENNEIERIPILGLKVEGDLSLYVCTSLTSLPKGLKVGYSLDLDGCESLESLPGGLEVGGRMNLWDCESLKSLPKGLEVGGDLILSGCKNLTSLPQDLKVGGTIYYNSYTGFAKIKGWKNDLEIIPTHLRDKLRK